MNNNPIGIFDSGLGGLSVLHQVQRLLPNEKFIYVADSGYAPYGCQGEQYVEQRSRIITEQLISQGAKVIVIACNTATASIIEAFRQEYGIPFIGVEPGIKPAIQLSKSGHIGVMATTGTLSSHRYEALSQRFGHSVNVYNQPCPGLADLVEAGTIDTPEVIVLLEKYIHPLLEKQVDTIVLGCTHYSFLTPGIREIVGEKMTLVDTSRAVAEQLARVLVKEEIQNQSRQQRVTWFTTGSISAAEETINQLLGLNASVESFPE